jgi:hypothetical protein
MSYTIPSDAHATGDPGHTTDHNNIVDVLIGLGAAVNLLPSGDVSGAADTAAIASLAAAGGLITLRPGVFYWECGQVTATSMPAYIRGAGRFATTVMAVGTGDLIRMYNPGYPAAGFPSITAWSGGVSGLTLDGSMAGAGSAGLHIGDGEEYDLDLAIQHFNGAGSIGLHLDNTVWWTEKMKARVMLLDNTSNVILDVSGANTSTESYGYCDLAFDIFADADQDGVIIQNGARPYHGKLTIRGNFLGRNSAPQTSAVLSITGTIPAGHPNPGAYSQIYACDLDIQVEAGSGTYQAQTINLGNPSNVIHACTGIMDFTQGATDFVPANFTPATAAGTLTFDGIIAGDFNLNPAQSSGATPQPVVAGSQVYARTFLSGANGNAFIEWGDFLAATLSADITVDLTPGSAPVVAGPQRKTFILTQAASGGPYTVTWPHPGSPSITSPAVLWPGGAAPVMSAGAGAVDVYDLQTIDGVSWYGTAAQDVS